LSFKLIGDGESFANMIYRWLRTGDRGQNPIEAIGRQRHLKNGIAYLARLLPNAFAGSMLINKRNFVGNRLPQPRAIDRRPEEQGKAQKLGVPMQCHLSKVDQAAN
jgi:hypothetical protein